MLFVPTQTPMSAKYIYVRSRAERETWDVHSQLMCPAVWPRALPHSSHPSILYFYTIYIYVRCVYKYMFLVIFIRYGVYGQHKIAVKTYRTSSNIKKNIACVFLLYNERERKEEEKKSILRKIYVLGKTLKRRTQNIPQTQRIVWWSIGFTWQTILHAIQKTWLTARIKEKQQQKNTALKCINTHTQYYIKYIDVNSMRNTIKVLAMAWE